MTDVDQAEPAATAAGGCAVCHVTPAEAGRPEEWRLRGMTRDLTGAGGAVVPRGGHFAFCPDCMAILDKIDDELGHPAFFEVVHRAPREMSEWEAHSAGLTLARMWMASVPLTLDQLPDFRRTFE